MKKSSLYQIGAVALVLAAGFFIYKQFVNGKKSQEPVAPEPIKDLNDNPLVSTLTGGASALTSSVAGLQSSLFGFFNSFILATASVGLFFKNILSLFVTGGGTLCHSHQPLAMSKR